jgi:uncharacterized protein (DUF433 family)
MLRLFSLRNMPAWAPQTLSGLPKNWLDRKLVASGIERSYNTMKLISRKELAMKALTRITFDPDVMGGKPCIRGARVTVGMIVGLMATGHPKEEILKLYPYLVGEDVDEALSYAAWRSEEMDVPVVST